MGTIPGEEGILGNTFNVSMRAVDNDVGGDMEYDSAVVLGCSTFEDTSARSITMTMMIVMTMKMTMSMTMKTRMTMTDDIHSHCVPFLDGIPFEE